MEATIQNHTAISPVDALWTLFMSQTKRVRKEFVCRILETETNAITPSLAKKIAKAEKDYSEGKTVHFNSIDEMDAYLDNV